MARCIPSHHKSLLWRNMLICINRKVISEAHLSFHSFNFFPPFVLYYGNISLIRWEWRADRVWWWVCLNNRYTITVLTTVNLWPVRTSWMFIFSKKVEILWKRKISKWPPSHWKVELGENSWKVAQLWPCRSGRGNIWLNWWLGMKRHILCLSQKDKIWWRQEFQNGRRAIMRSNFGQKILPTCNFRAFWSASGNLKLNIRLEMTREIIYLSE